MQQFKLTGVWKLQSFEIQKKNGKKIYPYGEKAIGYLIYTPEGFVSVHIMSPNRPSKSQHQFKEGGNAEKIESAENYGGYVGKYDFKGDHIIHTAEACGFTSLINTPQKKDITFSSNQLIISYKDTSTNEELDGKLIWEKVEK